MAQSITKVVVLGANGAMGAGAAETFAAEGIFVTMLARDTDKAALGRARVEQMAKSDAISRHLAIGSYEKDLARTVAEADLVFEAVSEDLALKQVFFEQIDRARKPDAIVATVSSGLSIAGMARGRSDSFARHFLGIHLFNPPNVIVGCEVIAHGGTDRAVTDFVVDLLEHRLGRKVIETSDSPAFAGNLVGFKVLNEAAQLAEEHGPSYIDTVLGPHTGRAMPPLATTDFVGWDVHKAIVDNVFANTADEAHDAFKLPAYMQKLIDKGHLGNKTPALGGFFRTVKKGNATEVLVLDPKSGDYRPEVKVEAPEFVRKMKQLHRLGRYKEGMRAMLDADGPAADLVRKVILGYVSYALGRVGEVVKAPRDVDRIMGFGFNWAPPSVIVDMLGAKETIAAMERAKLRVPPVLAAQASRGGKMFEEPHVDTGRFFFG